MPITLQQFEDGPTVCQLRTRDMFPPSNLNVLTVLPKASVRITVISAFSIESFYFHIGIYSRWHLLILAVFGLVEHFDYIIWMLCLSDTLINAAQPIVFQLTKTCYDESFDTQFFHFKSRFPF